MLLLILFLTFKLECLLSNHSKCHDSEGKEYESLYRIKDKNYNDECRLCECDSKGEWKCEKYELCADLKCIYPKIDEENCCRKLNCQGIINIYSVWVASEVKHGSFIVIYILVSFSIIFTIFLAVHYYFYGLPLRFMRDGITKISQKKIPTIKIN